MDRERGSGERSPEVCVVGSVNLDLTVRAPSLPVPGETVIGDGFARVPGGKGANQALGARVAGARVSLVAAVGDDDLAELALARLRTAGVDLARLRRSPQVHTGVAVIVVDEHGENQIAVAAGANATLSPTDVAVADADAVLCQLEVSDDVVLAAARRAEGLVVVNPSPVRRLPSSLLEAVDVLIVNEGERAALTSELAAFGGLVIVTRGADGAEAYQGGELVVSVPAVPVGAVDTVGAGDAFAGAVTAALASGVRAEEALRRGCAAGARATTWHGAQPPMDLLQELGGADT